MNAYELADEVKGWGDDLLALNMKGGIYVNEAAIMLRQQADRIAELEKAKTLTDEEIQKVLLPFLMPQVQPKYPIEPFNYIDFARAILRKAQEK